MILPLIWILRTKFSYQSSKPEATENLRQNKNKMDPVISFHPKQHGSEEYLAEHDPYPLAGKNHSEGLDRWLSSYLFCNCEDQSSNPSTHKSSSPVKGEWRQEDGWNLLASGLDKRVGTLSSGRDPASKEQVTRGYLMTSTGQYTYKCTFTCRHE